MLSGLLGETHVPSGPCACWSRQCLRLAQHPWVCDQDLQGFSCPHNPRCQSPSSLLPAPPHSGSGLPASGRPCAGNLALPRVHSTPASAQPPGQGHRGPGQSARQTSCWRGWDPGLLDPTRKGSAWEGWGSAYITPPPDSSPLRGPDPGILPEPFALRPCSELHPEHLPPSSAWPVTSSCHWRGHCPNPRPPTLQPRYSWGSGNQFRAEGSKCQCEEGRPCPPCPFKVTGALSVEGTSGHYRTRAPEHSCRDRHRSGQGAAPTSDPSSRENDSGPRGGCG